MKVNWFNFTSADSTEQAEEKLLGGVTRQSRPTMMENKLEESGVLYGNSENGFFWLMKKSEKSGIMPQRIFNGQILSKEGKTMVGGHFIFVGGFHLMWLVCMLVATVAILMMIQNVAVTIATAALFLICWITASICAPRAYKEEERQVVEYLQSLFPVPEEEKPEEAAEAAAEETVEEIAE